MLPPQLPLVTPAQSKLLKAAGFDWPCIMRYEDDRLLKSFFTNHNLIDAEDTSSAPAIVIALKWFRDVKEENCWVSFAPATGIWHFSIESGYNGFFDTYESAESALLDALLNSLISSINDTNDPC